MLKLTKTGIGLLTKQYRSVLRKCLLLNLGFVSILNNSYAEYDWHILSPYYADRPNEYAGVYIATNRYDFPYVAYDTLLIDIANGRFPTVYATKDALNYYYTFRVDERDEVIEFAEENDSLSLMEVCHA